MSPRSSAITFGLGCSTVEPSATLRVRPCHLVKPSICIYMNLYEFITWVYVDLCEFMMCLLNPFEPWIFGLHCNCSLPTPTCVPILLNQGKRRKNSEEAQTAMMTLCLKTPENSGKHFDTRVIGYGHIWSKMSQPTSGIASLAAKAGSAYPWTRELLVNLG